MLRQRGHLRQALILLNPLTSCIHLTDIVSIVTPSFMTAFCTGYATHNRSALPDGMNIPFRYAIFSIDFKQLNLIILGLGCMDKWIMHVDMDAFFASIEQLDHPELRGLPVIVGGTGLRSVVSAASYEARVFGIHSAMSIAEARKRCPHATFVPVRMSRYAEVSRHIMAILHTYSPLVEQASVDEAYMDATGLERLFGPVEEMAQALKEQVRSETGGLTCSIGLAPVKFLAKIASDIHKPDGLTILYPETMAKFLHSMPVSKIPGVGKHLLDRLKGFGVQTCAEVMRYPRDFWERQFGKWGIVLWERAQGMDPREVVPESIQKSESAEITFQEDTRDRTVLKNWLFRHSDRVGQSLRKQRQKGRIVTLKIKYADFKVITRRTMLPIPTCATETIYETACSLLDSLTLQNKVRLIGVGVSGFVSGDQQLFLPLDDSLEMRDARRARLDEVMDTLKGRFGSDAVVRGRLFQSSKDPSFPKKRS